MVVRIVVEWVMLVELKTGLFRERFRVISEFSDCEQPIYKKIHGNFYLIWAIEGVRVLGWLSLELESERVFVEVWGYKLGELGAVNRDCEELNE